MSLAHSSHVIDRLRRLYITNTELDVCLLYDYKLGGVIYGEVNCE